MKAKSIKGNSPENIRNELDRNMADGFEPTLAIIFISIKLQCEEVRNIFEEKNILIFGASTYNEFIDENIESDHAAILLLDLDRDSFHLALEDFSGFSELDVKTSAKSIAEIGKNAFSNPIFMISGSHVQTPADKIVLGILEEIGNATIVGGMASDESFNNKDYVFTNGHESYSGLLGLVLNGDKVQVHSQGISGWKPLGTSKEITESDGNWILTIDDQPALDLLEKYTGIKLVEDESEDIFKSLGAAYPLQVIRPDGTSLVMPAIAYNKETRAVMCARTIPSVGAKFYFTLPPDYDVVDKVIEMAERAKEDQMPEADALVIFSCVSRLQILGPLAHDEIDRLQKTWNVPMTGFFCYGEFGRSEGSETPDLIGTTCNWVALREKTA